MNGFERYINTLLAILLTTTTVLVSVLTATMLWSLFTKGTFK